jgi:hypothetical protein
VGAVTSMAAAVSASAGTAVVAVRWVVLPAVLVTTIHLLLEGLDKQHVIFGC